MKNLLKAIGVGFVFFSPLALADQLQGKVTVFNTTSYQLQVDYKTCQYHYPQGLTCSNIQHVMINPVKQGNENYASLKAPIQEDFESTVLIMSATAFDEQGSIMLSTHTDGQIPLCQEVAGPAPLHTLKNANALELTTMGGSNIIACRGNITISPS